MRSDRKDIPSVSKIDDRIGYQGSVNRLLLSPVDSILGLVFGV